MRSDGCFFGPGSTNSRIGPRFEKTAEIRLISVGSELDFAILGDRKVKWHKPRKIAIFQFRGCSLCLEGGSSVDFGGPYGRGGAPRRGRRLRVLAQQELRPGLMKSGSANFEVEDLAFSVARPNCDGDRRGGPPLAPPS